MKTSWEEEFERIMPKTSGETISYGQFTAVRNLIQQTIDQAIQADRKRLGESIEKMKEATHRETGSFKYDSIYDVILNFLKE